MRKDVFKRMKLMQKEEIKPNFAELGRRYGCDYRTVKKHYENRAAQSCERKAKATKLDPYKETVSEKLNLGCTAKSIYRFIKRRGFDGSYTLVKNYCRLIRGEETRKAIIRFETNAGLQSQVDWKESLTICTL